MPIKKDASGKRWVETEVEVPGTPEEVWQAIATGPGISSWFVPSKVEERKGGQINMCFGPGMDSVAEVTEWNPPHRFTADSRDDMGPDDPTVGTEWIVEARSGGKCVVRVVHSWFTDKDDWDAQFEGHQHGWAAFFRILRLYLAHFSGQPCSSIQLMGIAPGPKENVWKTLTDALGFSGAALGQSLKAKPGAPSLAVIVEGVGQPEHPELLLRLEEPCPGIAHFFAMPMAGQIFVPIRLYLYGDKAAETAARIEPEWQAWLQELFAAPGSAPSA